MLNLEITCHLISPLVEIPPMFDSLLGWLLGIECGTFCNKGMRKIDFVNKLPIPLKKEVFDNTGDQIEGSWFYKCSNPIYKVENEWMERWAKHTDVHKIAQKVKNFPKSISSGSGKYKQYYVVMNCKHIQAIKYFVVGDKTEIERILSKVLAIGNKRSYGYGFIAFWEVNEIEHDYSIYYDLGEQGKMLMKTIPECYLKNIKNLAIQNLRKEYGRFKLPYWYPVLDEVIVPC